MDALPSDKDPFLAASHNSTYTKLSSQGMESSERAGRWYATFAHTYHMFVVKVVDSKIVLYGVLYWRSIKKVLSVVVVAWRFAVLARSGLLETSQG